MQTSYRQQLAQLQKLLQRMSDVNTEEYIALNDAAGTVYAQMLREQTPLKPGDHPELLLETAIAHLEAKITGQSIKLSQMLDLLYRLRQTFKDEQREYRKKDNVMLVILYLLASFGTLFLLQLAVSFWKS